MPDGADGHDSLLDWARRTKQSLERARTPYEGLWRDIRDHFEPTLGRALDDNRDLNDSAAQRADRKIVNERPRDLVDRLSAGLQSGITNQARQWFRLVDKSQFGKPAGDGSDERDAIDRATETLQATIAGSNVYTQLISIYQRLGQFGTACALLVPDEATTIRLDVIDEGAYWIGQDRRGRVCTLLRRCEWTVRQIVEEFGREAVPERIRRDFDEGRTEAFRRVWNLVAPAQEVPRAHRGGFGGHPFASLYWLDQAEGRESVLAKRGFDYNPIIAPRWSTPTGSAYGVGLGQKALPGAKELQSLELTKLRITAQEADPPMAAPEDMRGTPPNLNPAAVNYYKIGMGGGSAGHIPIQPIDSRPKRLDFVLQAIQAQEERLDRLFYADLFAMLLQIQMGEGKRQMTATEVSELASEKIALLGPILTRLNHDLLNPLVGGVYALCRERAMQTLDALAARETFGMPVESEAALAGIERYQALADVEDMDLDVEYTSTLHIDQQANSRLLGVFHTVEGIGVVAGIDQQAPDKFDGDKAVDLIAESYMEHGVIRDQEAVDAIREGRAAQAEQQMRMAQAQSDADVQQKQAAVLKDLQEQQAAAGGMAFAPGGLS